MSRRMLLKIKLTSTRIRKIDKIVIYMMKIIELRNQLAAFGDKV
jgi:hypothetical protein